MAAKKKAASDTARVRMQTMFAGPAITYRKGDEVELSAESAARLVNGGAAVYVGTPPANPPVETATAPETDEDGEAPDSDENGLAPDGDETRAEE